MTKVNAFESSVAASPNLTAVFDRRLDMWRCWDQACCLDAGPDCRSYRCQSSCALYYAMWLKLHNRRPLHVHRAATCNTRIRSRLITSIPRSVRPGVLVSQHLFSSSCSARVTLNHPSPVVVLSQVLWLLRLTCQAPTFRPGEHLLN